MKAVETKSPSGTKTDTFAYDAAGNTTARPGQVLDWNAEGHLAKVTEGDKVAEFVYDADGRRLIRRDPTSITLYLDGQELRLVKATGKLEPTRHYRHGGAVVAMRDGTGLTWLASDHQDTLQIAVGSGDLAVSKRRQLPFGGPRGQAVAFPGEKGFVGGTIDSATGLTQIGARTYDVTLGRFLSVDPLTDLLDSQQMHGYAYSGNDPITKADPTGLLWWLSAIGAVAGFVALASPIGWVVAAATVVSIGAALVDGYMAAERGDNTAAALAMVSAATGGFGAIAKGMGAAGALSHSAAEGAEAYNATASMITGSAAAGMDYQHEHQNKKRMEAAKAEKAKYANTNLGPDRPKNRGRTTYYDHKGNEVRDAGSMPKNGKYQTSDGMYHRPDGKGLAWF